MSPLHTFRFGALRVALDQLDGIAGADPGDLQEIAAEAATHPILEERAVVERFAAVGQELATTILEDDSRPERVEAAACAVIALWAVTAEMDFHARNPWPKETRVLLLRAVQAACAHLTDAARTAYADGSPAAPVVAES